jgi:hypothetical protein
LATLTDTGFERRSEEEILQEMRQDAWDGISDALDLTSSSPMGQIFGTFSERFALTEELAEAVYNARKPDAASGSALTAIALITGTKRRTASKTTVACVVNVDSGFDQLPGALIAHVAGDPTKRFVNTTEVKNIGGTADNFDVVFEAETAGAVEVLAGTLTVIAEARTGWNSITNAVDGTTGNPNDSDATLRLRREEELQAQGSTTADAIRGDILRNLAKNITHCKVLVNEGNTVDANGLPPHSFECVVRALATDAAARQALAKQILASKCAGDQAFGSQSEVVLDEQGKPHTIGFTFVEVVPVYLEIDADVDEDAYPVDGDTQVKERLIAVETDYSPGDKVVALVLRSTCLASNGGVAGVIDVPALRLGLTASPVGTSNLILTARQIADFDTSRIVVNHV